GKGFVGIMMGRRCLILGFGMGIIWGRIENALNPFTHPLLHSNTPLPLFLFPFINPLLIPFPLHHIFHPPFSFQFPSSKNPPPHIITPHQPIFIQQIPQPPHLTSPKFIQRQFPVMRFGLPAPALAVYQTPKP
ncbi:PTS transporter subunit EIIC, partial [Staphylococcus epidermidis]|uniref:PTS transporter subunit EIIC n=1 Tax=Staphylococcus epidermidis TaxID=1282 RepID=UPI0016433161